MVVAELTVAGITILEIATYSAKYNDAHSNRLFSFDGLFDCAGEDYNPSVCPKARKKYFALPFPFDMMYAVHHFRKHHPSLSLEDKLPAAD